MWDTKWLAWVSIKRHIPYKKEINKVALEKTWWPWKRYKDFIQKKFGTKHFTSRVGIYFTLLGFSTLSGEPEMFCVTLVSVLQNPQVETGSNASKEIIGGINDRVLQK